MSKDKGIPEDTGLHTKYRPRSLDRIIGQEKIVTRLKGIVKTGKVPGSMLFVGASSAGKTTLARAFAADLFGVKDVEGHADYLEINAANARTIEDMRQLLRVSTLRPRTARWRVIFLDEAQQLIAQAEQVILKSLEKPPPFTRFILGSMEPEKLHQAVKNRCTVYSLGPYERSDLIKQVKRIAKGEEMTYVTDEVMTQVAENSNGEMRTAANLMQAIQEYASGLDKLPKTLSTKDVDEALDSTENQDQQVAVKALVGVYAGKFRQAHRALLDVTEGFRMLKTLLFMNTFLLNHTALKGEKHKSVWYSKQNLELLSGVKEYSKIRESQEFQAYATVQSVLVDLQLRAGSFLVSEASLISASLFEAIERIKPLYKGKD
jgi:DNA polymerase III gamma/tau subunit